MLDIKLLKVIEKGEVQSLRTLIDYIGYIGELDIDAKDEDGQTYLHVAVKLGYVDIVKELIQNKININEKDKNGYTSFDIAFEQGNAELIKLLSSSGATINLKETKVEIIKTFLDLNFDINESKNENGDTLLHIAVRTQDIDSINLLLQAGADYNILNKAGKSPFALALSSTNPEIVQLLLNSDSNVKDIAGTSPTQNQFDDIEEFISEGKYAEIRTAIKNNGRLISAKDKEGKTLLHKAVITKNDEFFKVVMSFLPNHFAADNLGKTPLHYADENGYLKLFNALVGNKPAGLMHFAVENNLIIMVKALLSYPPLLMQYDSEGLNPIEKAIDLPQVEILAMILRSDALKTISQVDEGNGHYQQYQNLLENCTLLHVAASQGWVKVAEKIIEINKENLFKLNASKQTPLHIAIENSKSEVVKLLLNAEADRVTIEDLNGKTALKLALEKNTPDILDLFISKNINDKYAGHTLLFWVAKYGYVDFAKKLIEHHKASLNWDCSAKGNTPLHIAAEEGHKQIVELLIANDAQKDIQGDTKYTALHYAVLKEKNDVVKLLVDEGARLDIQDINGYTPLHLAAKHGYKDAIGLLLAREEAKQTITITDNEDNSPLFLAAHEGKVEAVESLIGLYKIKKAWKDLDGTVLPISHIAAVEGWSNVLKSLDNSNRDLNSMTPSSNLTPLYLATKAGQKDVVKYLLSSSKIKIDQVVADGNNALHVAIKYNLLEIAELLLRAGADVNFKGHNGQTALHYAVKAQNMEATKLLLDYNPTLTIDNNDNYSPIDKALNMGNVEIIKLMLPKIHEYAEKIKNGYNLLHIAMEQGWTQISNKLISQGANIEAKTSDGQVPLSIALASNVNQQTSVNLLLSKGVNKKMKASDGSDFMHFIAQLGDLNYTKILTKEGYSVEVKNAAGKTPIYIAVDGGFLNIIRVLLDKGVNPAERTFNGMNLLHYAVDQGKYNIVKHLIDLNNVNINDLSGEMRSALHYAILSKNYNIIKLLIDKGCSKNQVDMDGNLPLHLAAEQGNESIYNLVFDKSIMNAPNNVGKTALYLATEKNKINIVKDLLAQGADVNVQTNYDKTTALHIAIREGRIEIVKELIAKITNINVKDANNQTPLFIACGNGHTKIVEFLLEKNPDLTLNDAIISPSIKNCNPLYIASCKGHFDIVKLLVGKGMDINLKASNGTTALFKAIQNGYEKIAEFLLDNSSDVNQVYLNSTLLTTALNMGFPYLSQKIIDKGGNVNVKGWDNKFPLYKALEANLPTLAQMLIAKGANLNEKNGPTLQTALHCAIDKNLDAIAGTLIRNGASVIEKDIQGNTPLHLAAAKNIAIMNMIIAKEGVNVNEPNLAGHTPLYCAIASGRELGHANAKILLEKATNIRQKDVKGNSLLHAATLADSVENIKLLLAKDKDLINIKNNDEMSPLYEAIDKLKTNSAKFLIEQGANLNEQDLNYGNSLLHVAALRNLPVILSDLLRVGKLDINITNMEGQTPLNYAMHNNSIYSIKFLLEAGANIHDKNNQGYCSFHKAVQINNPEIIKIFINKDPNIVNEKDQSNQTPLHYAVKSNIVGNVNILLANGASQNKDSQSNTPLHLAVKNNNLPTIKLLLENGADFTIKNNQGETPFSIAFENNYVAAIDEIIKYQILQGDKITELSFSHKGEAEYFPDTYYKDDLKHFYEHLNSVEGDNFLKGLIGECLQMPT
jgi:ankyrin repeat protein